MRPFRVVMVLAGALLTGCAGQPSPEVPQPVGGAGATAVHDTMAPVAWPIPLEADAVLSSLRVLRRTLRNRLRSARAAGLVVVQPLSKGMLTLSLDASGLFDFGSGQFKVGALKPCASLAAALAGSNHSVVWVVGRGPLEAGGEYGLLARRAQSVADDLVRHGVSPRRVRVITRGGRRPGRVDIVVVPLQRGREAQAYRVPA